jgi:predicted transcriptional regulator
MAESNFTVRIDNELKEAFAEAAKQHDRTGAQLVRDFMREYVQRARESTAYEEWFRRKVEAGRRAVRAGRVASNEEVEGRFAARRAAVSRTATSRTAPGPAKR